MNARCVFTSRYYTVATDTDITIEGVLRLLVLGQVFVDSGLRAPGAGTKPARKPSLTPELHPVV